MRKDKAHWPKCLLWHGWLPMLSGVNGASPWAADASESASYLVETALGQYSSGLVSEWSLPDGFGADEVSARMLDAPKVWSDLGFDHITTPHHTTPHNNNTQQQHATTTTTTHNTQQHTTTHNNTQQHTTEAILVQAILARVATFVRIPSLV